MQGNEKFEFNGSPTDFDLTDLWRFHYSSIYNLHGEIAEFLVARALGITTAQNTAYWTLWDITYRCTKIEVKATAYYHPWNQNGTVSKQRTFSIAKANGTYDPKVAGNKEFRRQNDIYVFCLNTGTDKESANPMILNNWEFYIVPTAFINKYCGDNKTISLERIQNFGYPAKKYDELKSSIDMIIDNMEEA